MHQFLKLVGALIGSALASYILVLMPFALFGKWRSALYEPVLVLVFVSVGLVVNLIGYADSKRLLRSGVVAAAILSVVVGCSMLLSANSSDIVDAGLVLLITGSYPVINALVGRRALSLFDDDLQEL